MFYFRHTNLLRRVTVLSIALSLVFSQMPDIALASNHLDPLLQSGNATVDRTSVPGETILIYSTVGTSTFAAPYGATNVRVLVVAGGGAGGTNYAGGGGAGEVIHSTSESVTPGTPITISVGAGGTHCTPETTCTGGSGLNSSFGSIIVAKGGGGGGGGSDPCCNAAPASGGSGGGGGAWASDAEARGAAAGTAGTTGANGVSSRNAGGNGAGVAAPNTKAGGGGGGAGAAGAVGTGSGGGKGGDGIQINITGTNTYYGGGGGGGSNRGEGTAGTGGLGGGGGGGSDSGATNGTGVLSKGQAGTANTGGGGGGSSQTNIDSFIDTQGGDGGSGIVIIRFTTQSMAITTTSLPDGTVTPVSYSQTLQVVGGTSPYTWATTTGNLPAGLSLNPSTGAITGQATATGTSAFTIQVTDNEGHIDTQALSITIVIPAVTTNSLPSGAVSVAYSETLEAAGGTTPYAWALTAGSLPPGLSLNPGTGAITGTPTTEGIYTFTVEVEDAMGGTDDQELSITITAEPVITTTSLSSVTLNTSYTQTLAASGGASPFTWSIASGALPAGLSLNSSTGEITGTPTTEGTYSFTVEVEDDQSLTDTQALSITVNTEPIITTTSLPGGTEGSAYSQTLAVSGGTTPFTWSVANGSLPDGISFDNTTGEISGTPTAAGTFTFTVQVEDASGATDTQDFSITIEAAPVVETSSRSSGTSIQGQVKNLIDMGKTDAAQELMKKWPHLFPGTNPAPNAPTLTPPTSGTCPAYTFTRNLRQSDEGEDVRALQRLLNCLGFKLAEIGPGAPGEETILFRDRTHAAVIKFQEHYAQDILAPLNLTKGTGYFAEMTRKKMGELLENGTNQ